LIVTCEECSTSFQLDESRIPATGAQVRCSRCKHAFFLANPSASASEATHAIAEEAAQDSMSGVPPVVADVPEPESSSAAAPPAESDSVEEDWQFTEEVRVEGDEGLDTADDLDGAGEFGDGLDADALMSDISTEDIDAEIAEAASDEPEIVRIASEEESGLDLDSSSESSESVRDESAFGTVDDFSSLMEDEEVAPVDLGGETDTDLATEGAAAAAPGTYAGAGATDDLGDPESWDLVGGDATASSKPLLNPLGANLTEGLPSADFGFEDQDASLYSDEERTASPIWQGLAYVGQFVGWTTTLALIGGALVLGIQAEWSRWIQSPLAVSAGAMTAETSGIRWVETSRAGFVMVVDGELRNEGRTPLDAGVVQLVLLDRRGAPLGAEPLLAGDPLSVEQLRESSPEVLSASAASASSRFLSTPLAPGEARAFTVIAREDDLPEDARRVLLEISDNAPHASARDGISAEPKSISEIDQIGGTVADTGLDGEPTGLSESGMLESDVGAVESDAADPTGVPASGPASAGGEAQVDDESGLSP